MSHDVSLSLTITDDDFSVLEVTPPLDPIAESSADS